ncbi:hypothetical protein XELAEV_18016253mg [Xenopus laevis]|uniref:Uncharacterized protein n=1 Tax=Xenopus laevis TaxID=8355 RepID=A0A974DJH9_XENLA|nr:hypothetical protein XELAEV_18016253mg [Xenopus laevis]
MLIWKLVKISCSQVRTSTRSPGQGGTHTLTSRKEQETSPLKNSNFVSLLDSAINLRAARQSDWTAEPVIR